MIIVGLRDPLARLCHGVLLSVIENICMLQESFDQSGQRTYGATARTY